MTLNNIVIKEGFNDKLLKSCWRISKMVSKNYRLGIDMGATSIGWAMILLDDDNEPCGVGKMGVRIFPDGREDKSKEPLSVSRRLSRGARRNRDRYLERMKALLTILDENNFLPKDDQKRKEIFALNPYKLRTEALDIEISKSEFARALLHLAKRRGFLSNRKTDDESESSVVKDAIANLKQRLDDEGLRTIGEYLYHRLESNEEHNMRPSIRFRYKGTNNEQEEVIFPHRELVKGEFELIWTKQSEYHKELSPSLKEEVYHAIFYQNPLKETIKGKCIFEADEDRVAKAHPLFQEFRYLQDVNNMEIEELDTQRMRPLSEEERQIIISELSNKQKIKFKAIRTKLFKKTEADNYAFNLETENRTEMLGNATEYIFTRKKFPNIAKLWLSLEAEKQYELVELLISNLSDNDLQEKLSKYSIDNETIEQLISLKLPADYANLSLKAIKNIIPHMREGYKYHEACQKAGYQHSGDYDGRIYNEGDLPYYGELLKKSVLPLARDTMDFAADEHGKINNPTVHIALNQLRHLVNTLTKTYGPPKQIVMELAREIKMSQDEKADFVRKQRKNTENNERVATLLAELGVVNNYENRTKYKLWEELSDNPMERRCIYTGNIISNTELFSPKIEIEHILPKSRTYDDSIANKTVSYAYANRYKGERSPHEAFGQSLDKYNWDDIAERASKLPYNKRRRFLKSAMDNYADESEVLARMLNDTRYMSRVAKNYLQYVVGDRNIWVVTGRQTAGFRAKWGLNEILNEDEIDAKNRDDHRHHAIDAFVIGMMSRSMINRFSKSVANSTTRFLENLGDPYQGFNHESFKERVLSIKVSFKPDQINPTKLRQRNQTAGPLLKETAYGYIGKDPKDSSRQLYSERKALSEISIKDIERVLDPIIKQDLNKINAQSTNADTFSKNLADWGKCNNVKKIKLMLSRNPNTMIGIKDKNGKTYKYYESGENLFCDIYCKSPWDENAGWSMEIINSYEAHQKDFVPNWKKEYPMAKLIMRLFKNDVVAITTDGEREYRRIKKMTGNIVYLRKIFIARKQKGFEDIGEQYSANTLKTANARKAGIDIIGRAHDPYLEEHHENTGGKP